MKFSSQRRATERLLVVATLCVASACASESGRSGGAGGASGGSGSAVGGAGSWVEDRGGSPGVGGTSGGLATGGAEAGGSAPAEGGSPSAGATAGASATAGGARAGTGSMGGAGLSGGATATGGTGLTGGAAPVGGTGLTGGAAPRGGTGPSGGAPASGGSAAMGGSLGLAGFETGGMGGSEASAGAPSSAGTGAGGGGGGGGQAFGVCSEAPPAETRVVTLYVIGDSTASVYGSDLYPRMGWGQVLGDYYSPACAVVVDKALSGRSSKSFMDEQAWTPVRDALVAGDYVLIQFGHNDEKSEDPARYTDPRTTYKQYLTTYVTDTRDRGAIPVLLTSIQRNNWDGATIRDSHGDYPPAVRELAAELDVALVDMAALTRDYFERIGQAETTVLFMNLAPGEFANYPGGNSDNTHLRETGARIVSRLLNADAFRQQLPLATLLSEVPIAP